MGLSVPQEATLRSELRQSVSASLPEWLVFSVVDETETSGSILVGSTLRPQFSFRY